MRFANRLARVACGSAMGLPSLDLYASRQQSGSEIVKEPKTAKADAFDDVESMAFEEPRKRSHGKVVQVSPVKQQRIA
jgi:hypothetical protein